MAVLQHFKGTEELVREIPFIEIANWFLNMGYFPEKNILPPAFNVSDFKLQSIPFNSDLCDLARRHLYKISHPKSKLAERKFEIQHPWNYHDILWHMRNSWEEILNHLFSRELNIFSYSFPIPVTKKRNRFFSPLRTGRMIYEWIEMAEKDLIVEANQYKFLVRTDIANFYPSVYTHSIGWALHGRDSSFADTRCQLTGNKIDKLVQYSNDARTNGIPIGSALSDLIAEILLAKVDKNISVELKEIDFIGVRFKDDYRILCKSREEAEKIIKTISTVLSTTNLSINENKTSIHALPDGLYRKHDREYFPHSIKEKEEISFKVFEHTLLIALDIHRKYPGTSILEKFISELYRKDKSLKIKYSVKHSERLLQLKKTVLPHGKWYILKLTSCHVFQ